MARKPPQIKVISYVHVGDQLVNTADLDEKKRRELATWIKCTYLNTLYEGKAKFYSVEEGEKEKHLSGKHGAAYCVQPPAPDGAVSA